MFEGSGPGMMCENPLVASHFVHIGAALKHPGLMKLIISLVKSDPGVAIRSAPIWWFLVLNSELCAGFDTARSEVEPIVMASFSKIVGRLSTRLLIGTFVTNWRTMDVASICANQTLALWPIIIVFTSRGRASSAVKSPSLSKTL